MLLNIINFSLFLIKLVFTAFAILIIGVLLIGALLLIIDDIVARINRKKGN